MRYRTKKQNKEATHGQHLLANVIKNFWQIYMHDGSLRKRIQQIRQSDNKNKLLEVHSREELNELIDKLAAR
jgi:hypothetical protein